MATALVCFGVRWLWPPLWYFGMFWSAVVMATALVLWYVLECGGYGHRFGILVCFGVRWLGPPLWYCEALTVHTVPRVAARCVLPPLPSRR